jgi:hypothetical protein
LPIYLSGHTELILAADARRFRGSEKIKCKISAFLCGFAENKELISRKGAKAQRIFLKLLKSGFNPRNPRISAAQKQNLFCLPAYEKKKKPDKPLFVGLLFRILA